jgi:hypothetical protein
MAAKPTGDIDRDFVAMIAPDHQGAMGKQADTSAPTQPNLAAADRHKQSMPRTFAAQIEGSTCARD